MFVGCVCVFWGLAIGGMFIGAIASCYLARGLSQTPGCLLSVPWSRSLLFFLAFVGLVVEGFLIFLAFSVSFFRFCSSLGPVLYPLNSGGMGGQRY